MRSWVFHPVFFTAATVYLTYRAFASGAEGVGFLTGLGLGALWLGVIVAWSANRARGRSAEASADSSEPAATTMGRDES